MLHYFIVHTDILFRRGKFKYNAEKTGPRDICEAVESIGFEASVVNNKDSITKDCLEHK